MFTIKGKYTEATIMIDVLEDTCIAQITKMCNNEVFINPIVIMPDAHTGSGSCVGFTMVMSDKIIPNVVSVDIGCGMLSMNVGKIAIDHENVDNKIREIVPFGININEKSKVSMAQSLREITDRIGMNFDYAERSIGSLGGGNHFIEIGRSAITGDIWITVHTGSRNLGKKICEYWQGVASKRGIFNIKDEIDRIKKLYPKSEWEKSIQNVRNLAKGFIKSDLDYLDGDNKSGYLRDMVVAQEYAELNRYVIMKDIMNILGIKEGIDCIETVHNYIDFKDNIIRKGSIRSYVGERMIIPFNMQAGILVCEGKSNPEWNYSAPHGAGRVYSRSKAKVELNLDEFKADMKGIFSTSVGINTIDESPKAYKDPAVIEACIEPTAKILDRIIPIHNLKSDDSENKSWKKDKK